MNLRRREIWMFVVLIVTIIYFIFTVEPDEEEPEQVKLQPPLQELNEPKLPLRYVAAHGSLGSLGTERELAKIRQKERDIILDDVLYNWTEDQKSRYHVWDYFWPTASCERLDRIGKMGDIKFICNSHKIKPPCVVYSFGCYGEVHFETILSITPGCEIFIFEPRPVVVDQVRSLLEPNMHFTSLGLGPVKECISHSDTDCYTLQFDGLSLPTTSLRKVYEEFGLGGSNQLDILRIDIENSEYWVLPEILQDESLLNQLQIKQILVEFHSGHDGSRENIILLVRKLEKMGFLIFQIEHNYKSPDCMDISFVHESFL